MKLEKTWQQVLWEAKKSPVADQSDVWLLMEHASGLSRSAIRMRYFEPIPTKVRTEFERLLSLRETHRPVQYITGEQNFMGFDLAVTPDVLIPRPETELLAERVINACKDKTVLDLCTGSGCIAIAVRKLSEARQMTACDISEAALSVAKENAKKHEAEISFYQGDLFEALRRPFSCFDIIVSNPPYIPTGELAGLMPEVRDFEPRLALDGAEDGLYFYRRIAEECKEFLKPDGQVFLEIGCEQGEAVKALFLEAGFSKVSIDKDYAGLDRIVRAER